MDMIVFKTGDKVVTKKAHACRGRSWTVVRAGADIKLTCDTCGHTILLTPDKAAKAVKEINGIKASLLNTRIDGGTI